MELLIVGVIAAVGAHSSRTVRPRLRDRSVVTRAVNAYPFDARPPEGFSVTEINEKEQRLAAKRYGMNPYFRSRDGSGLSDAHAQEKLEAFTGTSPSVTTDPPAPTMNPADPAPSLNNQIDRYIVSATRQGELPFVPTAVGPGLNLGTAATAPKGIIEAFRKLPVLLGSGHLATENKYVVAGANYVVNRPSDETATVNDDKKIVATQATLPNASPWTAPSVITSKLTRIVKEDSTITPDPTVTRIYGGGHQHGADTKNRDAATYNQQPTQSIVKGIVAPMSRPREKNASIKPETVTPTIFANLKRVDANASVPRGKQLKRTLRGVIKDAWMPQKKSVVDAPPTHVVSASGTQRDTPNVRGSEPSATEHTASRPNVKRLRATLRGNLARIQEMKERSGVPEAPPVRGGMDVKPVRADAESRPSGVMTTTSDPPTPLVQGRPERVGVGDRPSSGTLVQQKYAGLGRLEAAIRLKTRKNLVTTVNGQGTTIEL